jgi:hypothetical protein
VSATPAPVTKGGKDLDTVTENSNRMKLAYGRAFTTEDTFAQIDLRNGHGDVPLLRDLWLEENMAVGFFDVAIHIGHAVA